MPEFKLGRLPKVISMATPSLGDVMPMASEWPPVPATGWEYAQQPDTIGMLGNDDWGICGPAGAMHWIQTTTANTMKPLRATLEQCKRLYSQVAGFDENAGPPGDNPTDQGTVLLTLLQWWKQNGIAITDYATGAEVIHKIEGWASLDLSSIPQMRWAGRMLGGLYVGIECRQNFLTDTGNWVWDPKSPRRGGHCITMPGEGSVGTHIQSWGKNIPTTWDAMLNTLDEGYAIFTPQWLDKNGRTPKEQLDLTALTAAFQKLAA